MGVLGIRTIAGKTPARASPQAGLARVAAIVPHFLPTGLASTDAEPAGSECSRSARGGRPGSVLIQIDGAEFFETLRTLNRLVRPMIGLLWRSQMTAIAKVLARAFPVTSPEAEILKQLGLLCGAGLLVSLLMMTYGVDLSAGFF
jgi:hypothetical protein